MEWKEGNTYLKKFLLHDLKKETFRVYLCKKKEKNEIS